MQRTVFSKGVAILTSIFLFLSCMIADLPRMQRVTAAGVDYPAVFLRMSNADNSKHINIAGTGDKSNCVLSALQNTHNENWRFDYVGTDSVGSYYKITNAATGRLLSPLGYNVAAGTGCVIFGNENHTAQHWYVIPVSQDSRGDNLHYKIVNYDDTNMALTVSSDRISLAAYSASSAQHWLLNPAGLQGFGGYCKEMNGSEKAAVLGGTLGKIVEVDTFDELKAACTSAEPCTVLITKNISGATSGYEKVEAYDGNYRYIMRDNYIYLTPNKTIIGSYGANKLTNVYFRTYEGNWGQGNNIIIRNITLEHDKELNYDNIWEFSYGWNFWIDHINFVGHSGINTASLGSPDFDKFLNFKGNSDFISISDCEFGLHEYGVLLGYPTDDDATYQQYNGMPCVTLANNYYNQVVTRAPGLCRYGYFHSLNNYVDTFSMAYTVHSACKIYAEKCYYQNGGNVICDWNPVTYPGSYAEDDSVFVNCNRTTIEGQATVCTWRPTSNYSYTSLSAEAAKNYCTTSSGAQNALSAYTYAMYSGQYPSALLVAAPDAGMSEPPADGTLIQSLLPSAAGNWKIAADTKTGDLLYADRDVTYASLPSVLVGAERIITDCDGKTVTTDQGSFTAGRNMTAYVLLDTRVTTVPAWLSGWQKSTMTAKNSSDVSYAVYLRCLRAGEEVTLGTNGQSASCVNYTVMAAELLGDVNADGQFTLADLVALQKWLANSGSLQDAAFGDANADHAINSMDLTLLKRLYLAYFAGMGDTETDNPATPDDPVDTNSYEPEGFVFSGRVFTVGDSTVCEYSTDIQQERNRYGWGMKLAEQFNGVSVTNLALSGRSSRSFLTENNYQTLKSSIGAGDYLFIQFGHNDEKTDEATYPGLGTFPDLDWNTLDNTGKNSSGQYSYDYILAAYYINLAKNAGAVPVLVTPITRRSSDGTANYKQHTEYQAAMIRLGETYNVAVIDMTTLTTQLYTNLYNAGGAAETAKLHCYSDAAQTTIDNTHLSNAGAYKIASMIAEQTQNLGLTIGNLRKN